MTEVKKQKETLEKAPQVEEKAGRVKTAKNIEKLSKTIQKAKAEKEPTIKELKVKKTDKVGSEKKPKDKVQKAKCTSASKTVKASKDGKSTERKVRKSMAKTKDSYPLDLVKCIVDAMGNKKAHRMLSMDMRSIIGSSFDFFVICEAASGTQVNAIADGVEEEVYKKLQIEPIHIEGKANAEWILLDYGGVVVHVFIDAVRMHYRLEELWGDAIIEHYQEEE